LHGTYVAIRRISYFSPIMLCKQIITFKEIDCSTKICTQIKEISILIYSFNNGYFKGALFL